MPGVTLRHVPGMRTAPSVPVLSVEHLREPEFLADYVAKSRPCVIKGAIRHWPAMQRWRQNDHLKRLCGHHKIYLVPHEYHLTLRRNDVGKRVEGFADALDHLQAADTKMGMFSTALTTELIADAAGFPFLSRAAMPFSYAPFRFFFYRNAGTTWHFHSFDETLMCQVVGSKKIGLLNVDAASQRTVLEPFLREEYYDSPAAFDGIDTSGLQWLSATLDEGDALYIPQLWWHGVCPIGEGFGITTAVCWQSPLPVLADAIKRMASGEIRMVGMQGATECYQRVYEVALRMGLHNELVEAWRRGL